MEAWRPCRSASNQVAGSSSRVRRLNSVDHQMVPDPARAGGAVAADCPASGGGIRVGLSCRKQLVISSSWAPGGPCAQRGAEGPGVRVNPAAHASRPKVQKPPQCASTQRRLTELSTSCLSRDTNMCRASQATCGVEVLCLWGSNPASPPIRTALWKLLNAVPCAKQRAP